MEEKRSGVPQFHQSLDSFDSEFSDLGFTKKKKNRKAPIVTGLSFYSQKDYKEKKLEFISTKKAKVSNGVGVTVE